MSSFTPINSGSAIIRHGLPTPPPTPPPTALPFHPPPGPGPGPPTPPPTPVTPARGRTRERAPAPAPPSATPGRRTRVLCKECNRCFGYKNIADHRKLHKMLGDEGGRARPCKQCKEHRKQCYVAIHPKTVNTYACAGCLHGHKACSFKSIKFERPKEWADRHPNLLGKENIPPKEADSPSNSSASNSNSSLSTSVSSVEDYPHNRPWELQ
ncbi:hypothetical protein LB507_008756 [Fusarium sp. FIESC RH6]|nr:hypothetical protein LB507_008756 [Fusarium sp. FIESC RH6]